MSSWISKVALALLGVFVLLQGWSQVNSPFSRFGLGEVNTLPFSTQRGFGNLSAGVSSYNFINNINPASYTGFYQEEYTPYQRIVRRDSMRLNPETGKQERVYYRDTLQRDTLSYVYKSTTFETGVDGTILNTYNENESSQSGDGSLSYLAMGFPIPKFGGISFGLMPYTSIGYDVINRTTLDTTEIAYRYQGEGGLRQFYVGAAGRLGDLSIGFNGRVLFGTLTTTSLVYFPGMANTFGTRTVIRNTVGGMVWEGGAQYEWSVNKDLILRLGAYGSLPSAINTRTDTINERVIFNTTEQFATVESDTLVEDAANAIDFPLIYGGGLVLEKPGEWLVGIDYRGEQWSDIRGFLADQPQNNSYRVAFGGQIAPNPQGNFFGRAKYRVGGYFGQTPLILNGSAVEDFGMTLGVGIPIIRPRQKLHSSMDVALQIGRLGNVQENGFAENYVKLTLGFNLNDNNWIFKSKYY